MDAEVSELSATENVATPPDISANENVSKPTSELPDTNLASDEGNNVVPVVSEEENKNSVDISVELSIEKSSVDANVEEEGDDGNQENEHHSEDNTDVAVVAETETVVQQSVNAVESQEESATKSASNASKLEEENGIGNETEEEDEVDEITSNENQEDATSEEISAVNEDEVDDAAAEENEQLIDERNEATLETETKTDAAEKSEVQASGAEKQSKQENLNNTIKEIISDIDNSIKDEENVKKLKQQEAELLLKQQALALQIQEQQLLARQLEAENKLQQLQLQQKKQQQQQLQQQQLQQQQFQQQQSQYPDQLRRQEYEGARNPNLYSHEWEAQEPTNASRKIDLHKIFTPATDTEEITPKNRKHYASSAFYSPVHPTVEDQVELARRISHSLSDISNHTSKGQTMYVNRKKRSVKWVHEGCGGKEQISTSEMVDELKENSHREELFEPDSTDRKVPLKLLMNPRGQMLDFTSVQESFNTATGLLSPENCAELINALKTQKGKGAELFAKRRRKADEWVVGATNAGTQSSSGIPDIYQQSAVKPPVSPSLLPAYSDAGKHRVQLNMHQEQVLEKYSKPTVKALKTPWEAALETGSASTAFVEEKQPSGQYQDYNRGTTPFTQFAPILSSKPEFGFQGTSAPHESYTPTVSNPQRELAYRPRLAQGWKAPGVTLPKDLYLPKEIPLESYAPPPNLTARDPVWKPNIINSQPSRENYPISSTQSPRTPSYESGAFITDNRQPQTNQLHSISTPIKQFHNKNYENFNRQDNQAISQRNFNPSPLSLDKVAKFENPSEVVYESRNGYGSNKNRFPTQNYSQLPPQASYKGNTYTFDGNRGRNIGSGNSNAQNFNNSARGWKTGANNSFHPTYASNQIAINTANLPYTDF